MSKGCAYPFLALIAAFVPPALNGALRKIP